MLFFWGEGKTGVPEEKPLAAKERTKNKLNHAGIWTRDTLVGGECSHHCTIRYSLSDDKISYNIVRIAGYNPVHDYYIDKNVLHVWAYDEIYVRAWRDI